MGEFNLHCMHFHSLLSCMTVEVDSMFSDFNLNAIEHFVCVAPYEQDCKLANSFEESVLYNVLNGNYTGLFLYLTHSIEPLYNKFYCLHVGLTVKFSVVIF